jgi:hypothetical protein
MAPRDGTGFSLRWQFVPSNESRDRAVRWRWLAYTQSGHLFGQSDSDFETLTECMEDARRHGYSTA